jgi:hypothetical protein
MTMTPNQLLVRRAMRTRRTAEAARRRCNATLLRLEFPDRPRPLFVAIGISDDFNIVGIDEDGEISGIVIPFPKGTR